MISSHSLPRLRPPLPSRPSLNKLIDGLARLNFGRGADPDGLWLAMLASSDPETAAMLYDQAVSARSDEDEAPR